MEQKAKDFTEIYYHYSRQNLEWKSFMEKYQCYDVCEVGVRNGTNFEKMIEHGPALAVAVDSWIDDGNVGNNDRGYEQDELDKQYETFKEKMKDKPNVEIIREYSHKASRGFTNNFFDLVYIDANHTFEGCYQDLVDWYPKVKKGGIISGHDYEPREAKTRKGRIRFGVVEAVDKFAKENNLEVHILKPIVWMMIKP